jgi:hypothetical protein
MKKVYIQASRFALAGAFLLAANYGWAVTAACPSSGTALSNLTNTSPFNLYCYDTDKTFYNFAVSGTGTNGGVSQTTSTVDIAGANTLGTYSLNTPWTTTATFTGATAADFQATSLGTFTNAVTTGTMTWLVDSASTAVNTAGQGYPTPQAGASNVITGLTFNASGVTGNSSAGDSLVVTQTFCIGLSACTTGATGDTITIAATWANNATTPTYSCTALTDSDATCTSATSNVVTFNSSNIQLLNVTDLYTLTAKDNLTSPPLTANPTTVTLTNFNDVFAEEELSSSPEPSTFILMGSALVGVAALRFRKRKQA